MTIASEIQRIKTNIANAYTSCNSKGATMPASQVSDNLADCIDSISGGSGSETRKLTVKLINTMGAEDEGYCTNGGIFPQGFVINNTAITLNDCIENGFTYSMYVPNAVYSLQNLYCVTYQGEFSKDASISVNIYDPGGLLTQVETNNGVAEINNNYYYNQLTLSEDTIIKLFWGFDSSDIDFGDGGDTGDIIIK